MIVQKLSLIGMAYALCCFSSCIQDEPLNAECDIIGVDSVWMKNNKAILIGNPVLTNTSVSFTIKRNSDRTQLNPSFELTPGCLLTMKQNGGRVEANGAIRDFTTPQIYTTHSEDGNWTKDYIVSFDYTRPAQTSSFEHYELDASGRYHVWYEINEEDPTNPRRNIWCSGNAGFAFTGMGKKPEEFPTAVDPEGYEGCGVTLTTCSTGSFGALLKMPIAAGNLFIGEFKAQKATTDPLAATLLGKQGILGGKPVAFTGYYQYTPGKTMTGKDGQPITYRTDIFDIYAVLYEVDPDHFVPLDGSNSLTSERIVSIARIQDPEVTSQWKKFEIPFVEFKHFDFERLKNNGYAITAVLTSSRDGAIFEGAVGSRLRVDEVKIIWKEEKDLVP